MQSNEFEIRVLRIPGGETASRSTYQALAALIKAHRDLILSVYRVINAGDGTWALVLIGEKTSLVHYEPQIQLHLSRVQAEPIQLSPESLLPLVERFLAKQDEMLHSKETFFEQHHPLDRQSPSED